MPHRKTVRRVHEPGHLHELTFSTYQRLPLLTNHDWRAKLARSLDVASTQTKVHLVAFVFMPEHVHLLVLCPLGQTRRRSPNTSPGSSNPSHETSRRSWSEPTPPSPRRLTVPERPNRTCVRFWQRGRRLRPKPLHPPIDPGKPRITSTPTPCDEAYAAELSTGTGPRDTTRTSQPVCKNRSFPGLMDCRRMLWRRTLRKTKKTGKASGTHSYKPNPSVPPRRWVILA